MNYTTVWQHGQDEHIEKKSRFIGQAWPVHSEEEAREIIERTKKEFWDASHNVFTYRVGDIQRFTDDGEPSGTAGKPMLDVLLGRDLQNVLVIVTRYFGGTLLGTGGLVRAYTKGAQIAVEASLTGHFVFSTLHTNDAASTVTRLVDMGLEPFLICSSLVGVLSQRLLRRVCYACKTPYTPSDEELERLEITREDVANRPFYYGKGCATCHGTGYKGRKAICELLVVNQEIRDLIFAGAPHTAIRDKAREHGMRTVREDGLQAIYNGETTVDEVVRYT